MKHKLNVNGDIESRRRIAERRNVPVRETVQQTIQPQHHETEENRGGSRRRNRLPGSRSPESEKTEDRRGRLSAFLSTRHG
ncbi:hypothetical protein NIB75_18755 [Bacteroides uniformis]|nr:hypothetical protein [Bacteroides uniformis]